MAEDFTLWHTLAFAAGVAAALVFVLFGLASYSYICKRSKHNSPCHVIKPEDDVGSENAGREPPDLENNGTPARQVANSNGAAAAPITPQQLRETLKELLEAEISKGLQCSGLMEQLEQLEKQLSGHANGAQFQEVTEASACSARLRGAAKVMDEDIESGDNIKDLLGSQSTETPPSDGSGGSSSGPGSRPGSSRPNADDLLNGKFGNGSKSPTEDFLPGMVQASSPKQVQPPSPKHPPPFVNPELEFGPTLLQQSLQDPPEKFMNGHDEEACFQTSLSTIQQVLGRRDAQTTELHRQLKEARQCLWLQTAEARAANAHLQTLLSDPSQAPAAQAEALKRLQLEVKDLSSRLADAQHQEKQWANIAKTQRAFFMQSERMAHEGTSALKHHPAGDIFLAPPPVVLEGDAPCQTSGWDVGTSHCNPYAVDSWPFEPNVLAARAAQEPNLHRLEEEGEGDEYSEHDSISQLSEKYGAEGSYYENELESPESPELEPSDLMDSPTSFPCSNLRAGGIGGSDTARSL